MKDSIALAFRLRIKMNVSIALAFRPGVSRRKNLGL
jgi:hypothetical protein